MGQVYVGRVHHAVQNEIVVVADDSAVPFHRIGLTVERREREQKMEEAEIAKHLPEVVKRPWLALVGRMVHADDVILIVLLLAFLHGVVTDEGAVGGRCEEEGARDAGPGAEVDQGHVEYLECHGPAQQVHDDDVGQEVVAELEGNERPVKFHNLHEVVCAEPRAEAGVESVDNEEAHVVPTDAVPEEVAVVVEEVDAAPAVPAVSAQKKLRCLCISKVSYHQFRVKPGVGRHVHVAGLALPPSIPGECRASRNPSFLLLLATLLWVRRGIFVHIPRKVLGVRYHRGLVGEKRKPVKCDLADDEHRRYFPLGAVGVHGECIIGETRDKANMEHWRNRLEKDGER